MDALLVNLLSISALLIVILSISVVVGALDYRSNQKRIHRPVTLAIWLIGLSLSLIASFRFADSFVLIEHFRSEVFQKPSLDVDRLAVPVVYFNDGSVMEEGARYYGASSLASLFIVAGVAEVTSRLTCALLSRRRHRGGR